MNDELSRLLAAAAGLEAATGVKIVVVGGIARGNWAPPRNTEEVDVIAGTGRLDRILEAAPSVGLVVIPEEVAALAVADMTRLRLPEHLSGPNVGIDTTAATITLAAPAGADFSPIVPGFEVPGLTGDYAGVLLHVELGALGC